MDTPLRSRVDRRWMRAALAGLLAAGLGGGTAAAERETRAAPRLRETGRHLATRADWVTTDGARVVFGSGTQLVVAAGGPALTVQARRSLARPVSDAVLLGRHLLIVQEDRSLGVLDLGSSVATPQPVRLEPEPRGTLRVASMPGGVLVSEDGFGLRFLTTRASDHSSGSHSGMGHAPRFRQVGLLPLDRPITSVAAVLDRAYLVFDRKTIAEVRIDFSGPRIVQERPLGIDVGAIAAGESSLYVVGSLGAQVLSREGMTPATAAAVNPDLVGESVALAGRLLYVAAGEGGVATVRETSAEPQLHPVSVENDFFLPLVLEIDIGDTVQWTNASGLHNVFSCIPEQLGCDTSANETFVSGEPADPIWIYSYTFELPGSNPYICQSHAPFMTGLVEVTGAPVPTVSGWPLLVFLLLLLTVTTTVLLRRRSSY